jgi:hypothetical protein
MRPARRLLPIALLVVGCRTPAARLPTRMIDDPATLPAHTMEVVLGNAWYWRSPRGFGRGTLPLVGLRYGITSRLQLTDLPGFSYSVLDERPIDGAAPDRFTLVASGWLGWLPGAPEWGVAPSAGLGVGKRLGSRVSLDGGAAYLPTVRLRPSAAVTSSTLSLSTRISVQLAARLAVDSGAGARITAGRDLMSNTSGILPAKQRETEPYGRAGARVRVAHWLDAGVIGIVEHTRSRTLGEYARVDADPEAGPSRVSYWTWNVGFSGTLRW